MDGRPFTLVSSQQPGLDEPGCALLCIRERVRADVLVRSLTCSKPMTERIFSQGQLTASDGRVLRRTDFLEPGDEARLSLVVTRQPGPVDDAPLTVLYQDSFLLAVDKPSGILVHGDGSDAQTLTAQAQGHLLRQGSGAVAQALHRLDVDTSGIVLFSLAEEIQPAFDALIAGDGLTKRYYAVIEGALSAPLGKWITVDAPIARDRHDARRMRVGRTGKPARTRVRMVEKNGARSLIEAELETGRRHQIRVHLAYLGHPLVGDTLYGGASSSHGLQLCAHELHLTHPVSGEDIKLSLSMDAKHLAEWSWS